MFLMSFDPSCLVDGSFIWMDSSNLDVPFSMKPIIITVGFHDFVIFLKIGIWFHLLDKKKMEPKEMDFMTEIKNLPAKLKSMKTGIVATAYDIWQKVQKNHGYESITRRRMWKKVYMKIFKSDHTGCSFSLKNFYELHLLKFEKPSGSRSLIQSGKHSKSKASKRSSKDESSIGEETAIKTPQEFPSTPEELPPAASTPSSKATDLSIVVHRLSKDDYPLTTQAPNTQTPASHILEIYSESVKQDPDVRRRNRLALPDLIHKAFKSMKEKDYIAAMLYFKKQELIWRTFVGGDVFVLIQQNRALIAGILYDNKFKFFKNPVDIEIIDWVLPLVSEGPIRVGIF